MLGRRVVVRLLGVDARRVRVVGCRVEEGASGAGVVVVSLRARAGERDRCSRCGRRCPGYDAGRVRRWRALDWGRQRVFIEARPPRVRCRQHGVVTAGVPWARAGSRHTYGFEQAAAWCATQMSASAATVLLRCSWRTIGTMVARVAADLQAAAAAAGDDGLGGLRRIGIDEVSYRRGHTYLTVPDGGRGSRHPPAGVGGAGPGPGHPRLLLRSARSPADSGVDPRHLGLRGLDRPPGRRARPGRGALRRPVPCRALGRGTGPGKR